MPEVKKARAIGFNHIALEVGDIEEALAFYGRIFEFQLRGKDEDMAFIDLGDQFLALQKGRKQLTLNVWRTASRLSNPFLRPKSLRLLEQSSFRRKVANFSYCFRKACLK